MTTPAGKGREDEKNAVHLAAKGKHTPDRGFSHEFLTPLDLGIDVLRG
jgi:hypothetical protein